MSAVDPRESSHICLVLLSGVKKRDLLRVDLLFYGSFEIICLGDMFFELYDKKNMKMCGCSVMNTMLIFIQYFISLICNAEGLF